MFKEQLKTKWYWFARWLCRLFCMLFFRMRSYGRENIPNNGPFLMISNHQSYLDPILCGCPVKRQLDFLARESLFKHWFLSRLISSVCAIPVKLGEADISAMRKVIDVLKAGRGVCMYPEGTRTTDGRITPLKPGFGLLCRRGKAAVVPVVIDGAFECWPRHKKLFSPGRIAVCYGKAISAEQATNMGDAKLAQVLTETLRRMQKTCRIRQGKKPYDY
ncbi:MAG: 1-acyl-sn-glycerol-3-phosphate acyltransferase [Phycisphaerales bacterium]|nr:MAG: 1-acyl-sn-glycerol-3-phosphate acyltransferase [Phycisphaerales bacterium]